ncbi:MAG: hypothetical protein FWH55_11705 [Oscillospiraceae bacterium]|nr:hypothetical protein [Oscillospiraceae bacterium]
MNDGLYFLAAKCSATRNNFLLRLTNTGGKWVVSYAVKAGHSFEPGTGTSRGKAIETRGGISLGEDCNCPWCDAESFVLCNCCGGKYFACYDGCGNHRCPFCGKVSEVGGSIESVNTSAE